MPDGGARWRSRCRCTTGCGPSRSSTRSSGWRGSATTGSRSRASRRATTSPQVRGLLDEHGLECWGAVTLMMGGRDLLHEDPYVRLGSVEYVKDCLTFVSELGGQIVTVVPSTVGKIVPMALARRRVALGVEALKECQAHAESVGVRIGAGAAQPLRDLLPQPLRAGAGAGRRGRRRLRRGARRVPHEHRGVRPAGRDPRRGRPARRLPRRRQQPHAARARRAGLGRDRARAGRRSATTAT